MNRLLSLVAMVFVFGVSGPLLAAPWDTVLFRDDFTGPDSSLPDPNDWVIGHPGECWWVMGRTFFPTPDCHPGAPFPHIDSNACVITHYQYNSYDINPNDPNDPNHVKTTFLGGEIHTVMEFEPNTCYRFEARVPWPECPGGLVASFYTYGYDEPNTDSDEIDFEFLSNEVFDPNHEVLTNTWDDSVQCPNQVPIPELDPNQWQVFRIYWCPDSHVEWKWMDPNGDERSLRVEPTNCLPDEAMNVYFNFWAPDSGWPKAYDGNLVPDQDPNGASYEYWIDYVEVCVPEPAGLLLLAVGAAWFAGRRRRL